METTLAKILTLNTTALKDMPLAEVLEVHPLLNVQGLPYGTARKTKPIKVRPINTILDKSESDCSVFDKLLLSTLEGSQTLKRDAFICWGVDNDVWQQAAADLHKKYHPTEVDKDGWTTFVPNENQTAVMNSFQIRQDSDFDLGPANGFAIINPQWGDERVVPASVLEAAGVDPAACGLTPGDQVKLYLHYGVAGDWVLQRTDNAIDTYRVADRFFASTYDIESEQG